VSINALHRFLVVIVALASLLMTVTLTSTSASARDGQDLWFTGGSVTGTVGTPHYDAGGHIDTFPVTDVNNVVTTITVNSPDADKTHAIEQFVGKKAKVEYNLVNGVKVYDGIGPP